jgi:hypothetical protein
VIQIRRYVVLALFVGMFATPATMSNVPLSGKKIFNKSLVAGPIPPTCDPTVQICPKNG